MMDWFFMLHNIMMECELLLVKWNLFVCNLVVIHLFVMSCLMMLRLNIVLFVVVRVVRVTVRVVESLVHSVFMEVNWLDVRLIIELMVKNPVAILMVVVGIGVPICDILIVVMCCVHVCFPVAICLVVELVLSYRLVRGGLLTSGPEMDVFTLNLSNFVLIWCLILDILRGVMTKYNMVPVIVVHRRHRKPMLLTVVMRVHIFFIVVMSDGLCLLLVLLVILVRDVVHLVCGLVVRRRMVVVYHFMLMLVMDLLVMGSFAVHILVDWLMVHIVMWRLDDMVVILVVVIVMVMDFGRQMVRYTRRRGDGVHLRLLHSWSWLLHWCWFWFERHLAQVELLLRFSFMVGHGLENGMLVEMYGL